MPESQEDIVGYGREDVIAMAALLLNGTKRWMILSDKRIESWEAATDQDEPVAVMETAKITKAVADIHAEDPSLYVEAGDDKWTIVVYSKEGRATHDEKSKELFRWMAGLKKKGGVHVDEKPAEADSAV